MPHSGKKGVMKMKKRIIILFTAVLAFTMLAGCGKEDDGVATLGDYKVSKLVTLGDYKGLEVTVADPVVDEGQKEQYVDMVYQNAMTADLGSQHGVTDRAVADGDNVYISYVGKENGEAFDGGTSEGTFLQIGSNSYIEGFEEGLIGVMPGETVDLNLTFPENYTNADMAGKEVVFTVTVQYIQPEMSDEIIAAMGNANFANVAELNQYVHDMLMQDATTAYDTQVENAMIDAVINNAAFSEVPKELCDKYKANIISNMTSAATSYGYDVDTYTMMLYGTDSDTIATQFGEDSAKQGLAFQAIAEAEGLTVSDKELDEKLAEYAAEYGLASVDELIGNTVKEDYRDFFMFEKVIDFLHENSTVKAE